MVSRLPPHRCILWGTISAALLIVCTSVGVGCDRQFSINDDQDGSETDVGGPDGELGPRSSTFPAPGGEVSTTSPSEEPFDWLGTDTTGHLYAVRGPEVFRLDRDRQLVPIGSRRDDSDSDDDGRGPVHAIEQFDDERWLVSDATGLITMTRDQVFVSPLASRFDQAPPRSIRRVPNTAASDSAETTPNSTVWLTSPDGLFRWHDDRLHRAAFAADHEWSRLAWGPPVEGNSRIWLLSNGDGIQSLGFDSSKNEVTIHAETLETSPVDASVSDGESLWVVSDDGRLLKRAPDETWRPLQVDTTVTDIEANPAATDVWFATDRGEVWHLVDDMLVRVPDATWGDRRRVHSSGALVVSGDSNLRLYDRHYRVSLQNRPDDNIVESERILEIAATFPNRLDELDAHLDGDAIEIGEDRTLTLDPTELESGAHQLTVRARYEDDDSPVSTTWEFAVGGVSVTWTDDVKPMAERKCAQCHGSEAATDERPPLHTRKQWEEKFALIFALVDSGDMPRPPSEDNELTSAQIQMLKRWESLQFPE